jgi:hypothetical protein
MKTRSVHETDAKTGRELQLILKDNQCRETEIIVKNPEPDEESSFGE